MKKRVLAFLLAGMMVLAAGCGSKSMMMTKNAVSESSAAMDTAYAGSQYEEDLSEDAYEERPWTVEVALPQRMDWSLRSRTDGN